MGDHSRDSYDRAQSVSGYWTLAGHIGQLGGELKMRGWRFARDQNGKWFLFLRGLKTDPKIRSALAFAKNLSRLKLTEHQEIF